ncbi:MAG TPA: M23 family metallopeptidase [Dehalococcoidia bacterium]|nr:M23 family metallopeptidase [Dehalococcoidia bacterium]
MYAHFSAIYVKQGQSVKAGQALGHVGCTGHCTGNHLHFETLVDGVRVDPMKLLP